LISETPNI